MFTGDKGEPPTLYDEGAREKQQHQQQHISRVWVPLQPITGDFNVGIVTSLL